MKQSVEEYLNTLDPDKTQDISDFTSSKFEVRGVTKDDLPKGMPQKLVGSAGLFAKDDVPDYTCVGFFCGRVLTEDQHKHCPSPALFDAKER